MASGKWVFVVLFLSLSSAPAVRALDQGCQEAAPCTDEDPFKPLTGFSTAPAYGVSTPLSSTSSVLGGTLPLVPLVPPSGQHHPGSSVPETMIPVPLSESRVGKLTERYPSGELLAERRTFDGKLDGPAKEFYKNGQVMNEWSYRLGQLHGESRSFYRNGDLKSVWKYKAGKLHGETRHYHERKILKSVETYKDGVLVEEQKYKEGLPIDEAR